MGPSSSFRSRGSEKLPVLARPSRAWSELLNGSELEGEAGDEPEDFSQNMVPECHGHCGDRQGQLTRTQVRAGYGVYHDRT